MIVTTTLGPLDVSDSFAGRDAEVYASAVRLCARDMPAVVGKLPNELRPAGRILARSACGDRVADQCLQAISTHDSASIVALQAQVPDLAEAPPDAIANAYYRMRDDMRGPQGRLARASNLIGQGRVEEAASMNASAWATRQRSDASAPMASVGALRAHVGCVCPTILTSGVCTCGALS